jgi:hypothetical protein
MNTYYHTVTSEVRDFDPAWFEAMTEANNPKVQGWVLRPDPPSYEATTQHAPQWLDGVWMISDKTIEEIAAETRKVWPSSADFWNAFTDSEKLAIIASTIAGIILLREELRLWTGEVWSDDAKVQAGLTGLVSAGVLTPERKLAILVTNLSA